MPSGAQKLPDIEGDVPDGKRRLVIQHYFLAGFRDAQIARKLGITREAVRQHRKRFVARVKRIEDAKGLTPEGGER